MENQSTSSGEGYSSTDYVQSAILRNEGNLTALKTILAPPFVASSELRGTTSILWSCIITLIACIYTALHLNVPGETGKFRALATKGKWVLIGLLAPEVVLYLACSQFLEARHLAQELNRIVLNASEQKLDHQTKFDIKYGFFVVMRGLEVSIKDVVALNKRRAWEDSPRGTLESGLLRLTPNGVLQLASLGHFLHVPRSKIDDKSKADVMQKSLVMMQVIWMATQCIVRKIYGLPLSLLEVHTMVHVFCALVMYLFWMEKPLDMRDPELVDTKEYEDIIALMVQEQFHDRQGDELIIYPKTRDSRQPAIKWIRPDNQEQLFVTDENDQIKPVTWHQAGQDDETTDMYDLNVGDALACGVSLVARSSSFEPKAFHKEVPRPGYEHLAQDDPKRRVDIITWYTDPSLPSCILAGPDIVRLERVVAAMERLDGLVHSPELLHPEYRQPRFPKEHFHQGFNRSAGNFTYTGQSQLDPEDVVIFIFSSKILLLLLLILPAVYGGIHLIVINFTFPSNIERLVWKIAAINIMVTMPAFFTLTWIGHFISGCFDEEEGDECCCSVSYKLPGHVLLYCYIICRLFIVVESFISLRHVPIGVFWTPSWLQMIPHI